MTEWYSAISYILFLMFKHDYTDAYPMYQYGAAAVFPKTLECQTFPGIKIFIFEIIISSTASMSGMAYYVGYGEIYNTKRRENEKRIKMPKV